VNTFVYSDPHFGHDRIRGYCNRPFDTVDDMDRSLIANWNEVVKPNDYVIVLGDFGLARSEYLNSVIRQLTGFKKIIIGNHDKSKTWYKSNGFSSATKSPTYVKVNWLCPDLIPDDYSKKLYIALSHYPLDKFPSNCVGFEWLNIHGHSHNSLPKWRDESHVCVSVELTDYKPVNLRCVIEEWFERKTHADSSAL